MAELTPYTVYVDEAGDRGWGGRSSDVFVVAAVIIRSDLDREIRDMLDRVNVAFNRAPIATLHWSENIQEHNDRKFVARELVKLPVTGMGIVVCKQSLMGTGSALVRTDYQYNYPVRRLLERVSWFMRYQQGTATLRFAHVRRFKYDSLNNYLAYLRSMGEHETKIAFSYLKNGHKPMIEQPAQRRGLQAADILAGSIFAAVRQDRHGDFESSYLKTVAPTLWTGPTRKLGTYGLNFICARQHDCASHYPWLPHIRTLAEGK